MVVALTMDRISSTGFRARPGYSPSIANMSRDKTGKGTSCNRAIPGATGERSFTKMVATMQEIVNEMTLAANTGAQVIRTPRDGGDMVICRSSTAANIVFPLLQNSTRTA